MTAHDLKQTLRQRFDAGENLRTGLDDDLRTCPEAETYCRRLEALTASLEDLPLVAPNPALADAVKTRIRAARITDTWSIRSLAAALALCLALSIAGGYAYDAIKVETFSAAPLFSQVNQIFDVPLLNETWAPPVDLRLPQLVPSINVTKHLSATITFAQRQFEALPLSPWALLATSLAGLIIFNGVLISLQRRGGPGGRHPIV